MKKSGNKKEEQSWLAIIIINIVILLSIVTITEIILRVVTNSNTTLNINIGGMRDWHPTRGTQLKANYKAKGISINSYGILGPNIDIEPNLKGIRILTIGNSVTFSPASRNYSRVLEEKLNEFFPANDIEVVVGAVPGYCSYKALDWYNEFLYKLKPDISVIYIGWNDMGQYHPFGLRYKTEPLSYTEKSLIGTLMSKLYILRIPSYFSGRIEKSKSVDKSPLSSNEKKVLDDFYPDHYSENLKTIIEKLKVQGSSVYLVSLAGLITHEPTKDELERMHYPRGMNRKYEIYKAVYDKYQDALEKVAINTEIPIIDLRTLIDKPDKRYIFSDTMHINEEGADLFGTCMANTLRPDVGEILNRKVKN